MPSSSAPARIHSAYSWTLHMNQYALQHILVPFILRPGYGIAISMNSVRQNWPVCGS